VLRYFDYGHLRRPRFDIVTNKFQKEAVIIQRMGTV